MAHKTTTHRQSAVRPSGRGAKQPSHRPAGWQDPLAQKNPLVSGRWLVSAIGLTVAVAALCWYATLCLLFYQGQWQIVFHPAAAITATPASRGLRYDEVRFDAAETGLLRLAGWWVPAEAGGRYASTTALVAHDGRGNMSDAVAEIAALHALGVNVFAFDYRGFGQSEQRHPTESRVYEDADAAVAYLTETRHIPAANLVLYGTGLGATIAAETALRHPQIPAVVVENPNAPALTLIQKDARTSILPVRWLFRDRFELVPKLRSLGFAPDPEGERLLNGMRVAESPVTLEYSGKGANGRSLLALFDGGTPSANPHYAEVLRRFLDETMPAAPAELLPPAATKSDRRH